MNEYSIACGGSRSLNNRTTQQRHRRGLVMVALILGLICGCRSGPPSEPNPAERPVPATPSSAKEHPFASTIARAKLDKEEPPPLKRPEVLEAKKVQKKRVSLKVGTDAVTVELEITSKVEPEILEYLLGHLRLERFDPKRHQAMTPFFEGRGKLLQGQPEVRFPELLGPNQDQLVPVWPMGWEVVRPHVLRWVPWFKKGGPGGEEGGDGGDMDPGDGDVGSTTAALTGSWTTVTGSILCQAPGEPAFPLANVGVSINGATATAGPAGSFTVTGAFTEVTQLVVTFQGRPAGLTAPATAQMVIVNDFHEARGEHVPITTGTTSGRVLNVGALRLSSLDCELYEKGTIALRRYLDIVGAAPPASDGYRIKRWKVVGDRHIVIIGMRRTVPNIGRCWALLSELPGRFRRGGACLLGAMPGWNARRWCILSP